MKYLIKLHESECVCGRMLIESINLSQASTDDDDDYKEERREVDRLSLKALNGR